ncbi:MAG: tryptophan--tRNA ligase [Planctomycetota bacterium]|nr:tryptophan--tRNA ligase [Planctomycetota bacterium]
MKTKRILSGMRPTGPLHIGHLVGALNNWVKLQDEFECFYMVADWHAVMSEYKDTSLLTRWSIENVADWIAAGLDPKRSTIFIQSQVPEHAELCLAFACVTPVPWLERCPTYKEQMKELESKDVSNYAFLGYPVLQAADIALYKADTVPVGEDQVAHLELTREIVRRFNSFFGEIFPEPMHRLTATARLLGLDRRKMSKSYGNFIALGETPEDIRKKVSTMFTDQERLRRSDPGHPDVCNVFAYYQAFAPDIAPARRTDCTGAKVGCTDCKRELGDRLAEFLRPLREKRTALLADPKKLREILDAGAEKARKVARATMEEVHAAVFKKRVASSGG